MSGWTELEDAGGVRKAPREAAEVPASWTPPAALPGHFVEDGTPEPEAFTAPSAPSGPRLFLTLPVGARRSGLRTRLARSLGLDVWGDALLGPRAADEMEWASVLLTLVFFFELGAWTLLFNVVVHSASWTVSPLTLLALAMGMLFATVVFLYERSFVTADFSATTGSKQTAVVIRVMIICLAAVATAQPVELLVFSRAIERRLHDEGVLAEAVRQTYGLAEDDAGRGMVASRELDAALAGGREEQQLDAAATAKAAARAALIETEAALQTRRGELDDTSASLARWRSAARRLQAAVTEEAPATDELDQANRRVRSLGGSVARLQREVRELEETLAIRRAEAEATTADEAARDEAFLAERERLRAGETAARSDRADKAGRRRQWMDRVRQSAVGEVLEDDEFAGGKWDPYDADFIERLAIVHDLRNGRSPKWPASTEEIRLRAVAEFGVADPTAEGAEHASEYGAQMNRTYWVAFFIALIVPLLTLAFKALMSRELKAYYSTLAQARAGNPEAIRVLEASSGKAFREDLL